MTGRARPDRDIEAQLHAARPEPTLEVTRAISDCVRPRRSLMGWHACRSARLSAWRHRRGRRWRRRGADTAAGALNGRKPKTRVAAAPAIQQ